MKKGIGQKRFDKLWGVWYETRDYIIHTPRDSSWWHGLTLDAQRTVISQIAARIQARNKESRK